MEVGTIPKISTASGAAKVKWSFLFEIEEWNMSVTKFYFLRHLTCAVTFAGWVCIYIGPSYSQVFMGILSSLTNALLQWCTRGRTEVFRCSTQVVTELTGSPGFPEEDSTARSASCKSIPHIASILLLLLRVSRPLVVYSILRFQELHWEQVPCLRWFL